MPSSTLALVLAVGVAVAFPLPDFHSYVKQFNKNYDPLEYSVRQKIFDARIQAILTHNAKGLSHMYGVNNMTDWREDEVASLFGFDRVMNDHRRALRSHNRVSVPLTQRNISASLPAAVNWALSNATTPVKNQGGCGSCWAFAATSSIESDIFIETGHLPILAPQLYVDCVSNSDECGGTGGCAGATPEILFDYAEKNGARLEEEYPYTAQEGVCLAGRTNKVAIIDGFVDTLPNDHNALMAAVVRQPVTISVAANTWSLYSTGVLKFEECDADLNHAVLLVGYGTDPVHGDYWLVQNSWGPGWGEGGFIRLERTANDGSRCREDAKPHDGSACKGQDLPVTACGTCGMLYSPSYPTGGKML